MKDSTKKGLHRPFPSFFLSELLWLCIAVYPYIFLYILISSNSEHFVSLYPTPRISFWRLKVKRVRRAQSWPERLPARSQGPRLGVWMSLQTSSLFIFLCVSEHNLFCQVLHLLNILPVIRRVEVRKGVLADLTRGRQGHFWSFQSALRPERLHSTLHLRALLSKATVCVPVCVD